MPKQPCVADLGANFSRSSEPTACCPGQGSWTYYRYGYIAFVTMFWALFNVIDEPGRVLDQITIDLNDIEFPGGQDYITKILGLNL